MGEHTPVVRKIDQAKAFMAYGLMGGDVKRVALLMRCEPSDIESLAHDFNWKGQFNGVVQLDTDEGKKAQREIHRVSVYITADRARQIIVNILDRIQNDENFARSMTTKALFDESEALVTFDGKGLLDLVKGLQMVTDMAYRALGDTEKASDGSSEASGAAAGAAIATYQALQKRFNAKPVVDTVVEVSDVVRTPLPA